MKTIGVKFRTENIKTLTEGIRIKKNDKDRRASDEALRGRKNRVLKG